MVFSFYVAIKNKIMPLTNTPISSETEWILGFDGGCTTCIGMAQKVETISEGKISTISLYHPEAQLWRAKTVGINSPWVPTLFEIKGEKVKAWTGLGMTLQFIKLLGVKKSWKVIGAIGQVDEPSQSSSAQRRNFLKAFSGGLAATVVIAMGGRSMANPALDESAGKITAELADKSTYDEMISAANKHSGFLKLKERVKELGFGDGSQPKVYYVEQGGKHLRTLLMIEYYDSETKTSAGLAFGYDAQKRDEGFWTHIIVNPEDEQDPGYMLKIDEEGNIKKFDFDKFSELKKYFSADARTKQIPQGSRRSCRICKAVCGLGCNLGANAVCSIVCGGEPLCSNFCVAFFFAICNACGPGCDNTPFCP